MKLLDSFFLIALDLSSFSKQQRENSESFRILPCISAACAIRWSLTKLITASLLAIGKLLDLILQMWTCGQLSSKVWFKDIYLWQIWWKSASGWRKLPSCIQKEGCCQSQTFIHLYNLMASCPSKLAEALVVLIKQEESEWFLYDSV